MAAIKDLLRQITDPALRDRLSKEIDRMAKNKKFGLVFEEHIPECTPLYGVPITRGSTVARKAGKVNDIYTVKRISGDDIVCENKVTHEIATFQRAELVSVAQFGEPIFPSLEPIDKVENAPGDSLWHTLIEADNYHALQLLEYLYEGKVDCIYIDPPYNTGARDWKYNNDYVDSNDAWRHSKWLSMMQKRLRLAKRILNPEKSILIISIDDNELYSLGCLLSELFPEAERQIIDITINPKGKARDGRLSQVDEYLLILYFGTGKALEQIVDVSEKEIRWPYLRRSDVESARGTKKGGVRQFYPIYVDTMTHKVVCTGEALTPDQNIEDVPQISGAVPVFPIREDGKHMNWGLTAPSFEYAQKNGFINVTISSNRYQPYNFAYVTMPSIKKVEEEIYHVIGTRENGSKIVTIPNGKPQRSTTSWAKNLFDANAYGSQLIGAILPDVKFPFPKSIYSVSEVLRTFVLDNPNALIVDFFAGSGTTLHAINLLNAEDGGKRQCILVTNNEVSDSETNALKAAGFQPGDDEWEKHGICRSVTWPRTKFSILGKRTDGVALTGEYFTSQTVTRELNRSFYQLGFVENPASLTPSAKKQIVASIGGQISSAQKKANRIPDVPKLVKSAISDSILPQSLVTADKQFIVSEKHTASVLFNSEAADEWLAALEDQEHITDFYIVAKDNRTFNDIKAKVVELLGTISVTEPLKRPMSQGFAANVEYFKLGFLDKNSVSLGQQFAEILPLLWLKAGTVGERPELDGECLPDMLILPQNAFAILLDEDRYGEFAKKLLETDNIRTVYFVTNSEEAFREMSDGIGIKPTYQLYRDYIDNFVIGSRRNNL